MAILLTDAVLASMTEGYGLIPDGAVACEGAHILWVGAATDLPARFARIPAHSVQGRLVSPALIDCHSHVVFGGNRANEFEMRLNGASYEEVARAGGGIVSTVRATRQASEPALLAAALIRVDQMLAEGLGTLEIKSGYGLDIETELKMLRVARQIGECRKLRIVTSFLGAHALPENYRDRADAYIEEQVLPALRAGHAGGLIDAVDGFCEGIAFSVAQMRRVFDVARELGLPVKLHAEQLSNLGGAALAAGCGALSADHLEYLDEAGVQAMAASGTVAVLLPGAFYALREPQAPPIALLRKHGVPIALATDRNPGTSPMASLGLAMNMACTLFRMTPLEALRGTTCVAARALGLSDRGQLAAGQLADIAIWEASHPAELSYNIGATALHARIHGGEFV
jgi:imidazolonepropionase